MNEKKHGGPRKGAGRKSEGLLPKETTSISLDALLLDAARREAQRRSVSLSKLIEELLEAARPTWSE